MRNPFHLRKNPLKIESVTKPNHLRPIVLCSMHYKIVSKLLAVKIKPLHSNLKYLPVMGPFKGKTKSQNICSGVALIKVCK